MFECIMLEHELLFVMYLVNIFEIYSNKNPAIL
jgi:hypothetical protein